VSAAIPLGTVRSVEEALRLAAQTMPKPPAAYEEFEFMLWQGQSWEVGRIVLELTVLNEAQQS